MDKQWITEQFSALKKELFGPKVDIATGDSNDPLQKEIWGMKTGDKKKVLPFSKFQKIRLFSVYPILALAFAWCIVKIDTFTIDWRLLPLVLFIIAGVTHTVAKRHASKCCTCIPNPHLLDGLYT
ncbi:hypothetical protein [Olivibacter domesticus]|uniref:hypothetical protein n=1 Tax=Olivibacter domesticus TaxID=407022 RepID=UPI000B88DC58|nr:hypothetical protein [Olivibacter domesticus]